MPQEERGRAFPHRIRESAKRLCSIRGRNGSCSRHRENLNSHDVIQPRQGRWWLAWNPECWLAWWCGYRIIISRCRGHCCRRHRWELEKAAGPRYPLSFPTVSRIFIQRSYSKRHGVHDLGDGYHQKSQSPRTEAIPSVDPSFSEEDTEWLGDQECWWKEATKFPIGSINGYVIGEATESTMCWWMHLVILRIKCIHWAEDLQEVWFQRKEQERVTEGSLSCWRMSTRFRV